MVIAGRTLAAATARETRHAVAHPGRIFRGRLARVDTRSLAKIARTGPDTATVLRGPLSAPQRTTWTTPMSINDVKQIGRPTGATVNDVMLAALAGALRDYLTARGSLVDEIRAYMPFNLRPSDEPIPRELGNLFGLVFLTLPVGVPARRERLACVQRRMTEIKRSGEGRVEFDGLCAIGTLAARQPAAVDRLLLSEGDRGRIEHGWTGQTDSTGRRPGEGHVHHGAALGQRRAGRDDLQLQRPRDHRRQRRCRSRAPT